MSPARPCSSRSPPANAIVEATRTIQLALQNAEPVGLSGIGSPATTTIAIGNNDVGGTIQWSPASVSALESAATVTLNAARTGGAAGPVGATWTITGGDAVLGVDYTGATTGTVDFAANSGVPVVPVTISLLNPAGPHGNRTIEVTLSNQTGGAVLGSAKVFKLTLLDDEVGFRFDKAAYATNEGIGSQRSPSSAPARPRPPQASPSAPSTRPTPRLEPRPPGPTTCPPRRSCLSRRTRRRGRSPCR